MAEVEVHLRPRYQCSVCRRSWSTERRAKEHASACVKDPATRACATCLHEHWGDGFDEPGGPRCDLGIRDADTIVIRNCESWETRRP